MKIARVQIRNFRVHRETDIRFENLTAFIGRNGVGKSSVLYALDFFYDVSSILTADDVYAGEDEEVTISVVYSKLSDAELDEFGLYVRGGEFEVIKRARPGQPGRYYGIVPQLPEFAQVRAVAGAREQRRAYNEVRELGRLEGLPPARNQTEVLAAMDEFERCPDNRDLLQPIEREEQFFGDRRAGAGRLDNYTSFVLVPAVREAADESDRKGAIQTLADRLVSTALASRDDIIRFREEFEERFRETYSADNLTEIERVSEQVNELLGRYAPGLTLRLRWQEAVPPQFGLPPFETRIGDSTYDTPIPLQGHGTQRALVFSLLQLMAQQRAADAFDDEGGETHDPDLIVAIEEPELYLHPAQCRYLARLLEQLASDSNPPTMQVMYATHSPYFVRMESFEQIRVVRRRAQDENEVPCSELSNLDFGALQNEIARIAEIDPKGITQESFIARCASVMDVVANEGFFASAAVIVEGYSDLGSLRAVEQQLGLNWDERGIVVVPARSKNNIDRPVYIFRGLGIPCYFLFDGDASLRGKDGEENAARANRLLLRLAGVEPEDFPDTQVQTTWAVIGDNLEAELRAAFADARDWEEATAQLRVELGFASVPQMLKNPDGAAAVVRRAYDTGRSIPVLEQVARRVTDRLT